MDRQLLHEMSNIPLESDDDSRFDDSSSDAGTDNEEDFELSGSDSGYIDEKKGEE